MLPSDDPLLFQNLNSVEEIKSHLYALQLKVNVRDHDDSASEHVRVQVIMYSYFPFELDNLCMFMLLEDTATQVIIYSYFPFELDNCGIFMLLENTATSLSMSKCS